MAQRKALTDKRYYGLGTEDESNVSIAESLTPEVHMVGGIYRSTPPTYTANDNAVVRMGAGGELVVTPYSNVVAAASTALDLTDASAANRRYDTTFTKSWELSHIQILFSTTQSRDITISLNDGTNLYTLVTDAGDASTTYIFAPSGPLFGTATDEIRIQYSQAGGACTATSRIITRDA